MRREPIQAYPRTNRGSARRVTPGGRCRIAVGPHQVRKAFCLYSLPPVGGLEESSARVAKVAGFSLHAVVAAARHERRQLERLCRHVTRPAIAKPRLSLTPHGNVRYQLKTPYRDGTTHVFFDLLYFMKRKSGISQERLPPTQLGSLEFQSSR